MEFPKEVQDAIIEVIEKSTAGITLTNGEAVMLFHYVRNKDLPEYQFVKDYLAKKNKKKKRGSPVSQKHSRSKGKPKSNKEDSSN